MADPVQPRPVPSVHRGELLSAFSAVLLLVIMFAFAWYGVDALPGRPTQSGISTAENAWMGLTVVRWLMLATIAVTLGSVVLHANQRGHGAKTHTGLPVMVLGSLTAAALVFRVLADLPQPASVVDQKLGALLGLLSAVGIALGGFQSMREERARSRNVVQRSRKRSGLAYRARAR